MKKYKKNITVTVTCIITELMICLIPMLVIMHLFLDPRQLTDSFVEMMGILFIVTVTFDLFLYIIGWIGKLFIRTEYYINHQELIVRRKNKDTVADLVVDLRSVHAITYDVGNLSKRSGEPSTLVLFDQEYKDILTVKNPPLVMVAHVKRACHKAKVSYYNAKRFLIFLLMFCAISVGICLLGIVTQRFA